MDHNSYSYNSQYEEDIHEMANESYNISENANYLFDIENITEKDGDILLISLVHDHPYLYNIYKALTDFKDNVKKQNAWMEIANILDMTADDCQSRWTRLRERYAREKKQKVQETTTGSGATKRKSFEFFKEMEFLEPFVKRRRTMTNVTNVKRVPMLSKYNFQKNFVQRSGQKENNLSSTNMATSTEPSLRNINDSESVYLLSKCNLQRNFVQRSGQKEDNLSSTNVTTSIEPFSRNNNGLEQNQDRFNSTLDSAQNKLKVGSSNESQTNLSFMNATTFIEDNMNSAYSDSINLRDSTSPFHSNVSDTSSISAFSASDYARNKGQRIRSKGKAQPDVLQNAICKVTSLLENRYSSSTSSSSSSLKPDVKGDIAFCQLILSSFTNMPQHKNIEKKKKYCVLYISRVKD